MNSIELRPFSMEPFKWAEMPVVLGYPDIEFIAKTAKPSIAFFLTNPEFLTTTIDLLLHIFPFCS